MAREAVEGAARGIPERQTSLLNPRFAGPQTVAHVQALARAAIASGRYRQASGGGFSIRLDMGEEVGWANGTPTQWLEVRVDTRGGWHFYPSYPRSD